MEKIRNIWKYDPEIGRLSGRFDLLQGERRLSTRMCSRIQINPIVHGCVLCRVPQGELGPIQALTFLN